MISKNTGTSALAVGTIDSVAQKFLDTLEAGGAPPIQTLTPQDARNLLVQAQAVHVGLLPADIEDLTISGGPTGQVHIRIVRPHGRQDELPAIMYFHGGGWVLGDKETHDRLVRQIAAGSTAAVIFVDYDRSPEARYPTAIEQAYAATEFAAAHAEDLNLDPTRLAVAGDSVGGNMATVVAMLAKARGGPKIRFQALFYPATDASFDTPSYNEFAEGPWLTKAAMQWFWDAYLPDVSARHEPTASPLRASLEDLRGLPPALVITDENDVLRDEGEAYAHKLIAAGVSVTATRYLATIHDFMMLNALADTPAVHGAIAQANLHLRRAFAL
jgi:acetyl esterase